MVNNFHYKVREKGTGSSGSESEEEITGSGTGTRIFKKRLDDFKNQSEGFNSEWLKEFLDSNQDDQYFDHVGTHMSNRYPMAVSSRHFQEILAS